MQAVGQQDLQGLLQTCSASFSRWFMAHMPPLLARHPAAAALSRPLEHFSSDQVSFSFLHPIALGERPLSMSVIISQALEQQ